MNDLSNYFNLLDTNKLDIWKNIDISDLIDTDYELYEIKNNDNLMGISYRYYQTIDEWWIIYLYNEMYDINFDIPTDRVIEETIKSKLYNIENYGKLISKEKLKTIEMLRVYFNTYNSLEDSIKLTNNYLNSSLFDDDFYIKFTNYLNIEIISNSYIKNKIKIPSFDNMLKIKNRMESYSLTWSNNGN